MDKTFFNFEIFGPIVVSKEDNLSETLNSLYQDYEILPMYILTDRKHPAFNDIVDKSTRLSTSCIIIPIRYLNTFLS